jgi:heptaprenyl diphosphate synthase
VVDQIAQACQRIGIAWQVSDDVIDLASTPEESGKAEGTDLKQGVRTLPVLYALRSSSADPDEVRLRELLSLDSLEDAELHAEALVLLRKSPAMAEARDTVRSWIGEATAIVSSLPDVPARAAFESLCDFVSTRTG